MKKLSKRVIARQSEKMQEIDPALHAIAQAGGEVHIVGGAVRDKYLGKEPKDIDLLITKIPLDKLKEILSHFGEAKLVGESFGVIKFVPTNSKTEYDFAIPRKEKSTGDGHKDFKVEYDHTLPVEDDLKRRDFTFNSLAEEYKTGKIKDPHGGLEDIKNKILRLVNKDAIREDPLRAYRAIQFAARFGFKPDQQLIDELKKLAPMIPELKKEIEVPLPESEHRINKKTNKLVTTKKTKKLSEDRISAELGKLMKSPKPSVGLNILRDTGILEHTLPGLEKHFDICSRAVDNAPHDISLRMAALLAPLGFNQAKKIIEELKLSTVADTGRMLNAIRGSFLIPENGHLSDVQLRNLVGEIFGKIGRSVFDDAIEIKQAVSGRDLSDLASKAKTVSKGIPVNTDELRQTITGHDLQEIGISEKTISIAMNDLVKEIINDPSKNERNILLEHARKNKNKYIEQTKKTISKQLSRRILAN